MKNTRRCWKVRTKAKNAPMRLNSTPGSIEEIPGFGIAKTPGIFVLRLSR